MSVEANALGDAIGNSSSSWVRPLRPYSTTWLYAVMSCNETLTFKRAARRLGIGIDQRVACLSDDQIGIWGRPHLKSRTF